MLEFLIELYKVGINRMNGKADRRGMIVNKKLLVYGLVVVVLVGLGLVGLYAAGIFTRTSQASTSQSAATQVITFQPTGIRETAKDTGNCWESSLAAPRANAWRCMVVNSIYDPCFSVSARDSFVICNANPAGDARGMKVMLSKPLPTPDFRQGGQQAWLLKLSDGAVCSFFTGATGIIDGQRINYGCTDKQVIAGAPRTGIEWTVKEIKTTDSGKVVSAKTVKVETAWL